MAAAGCGWFRAKEEMKEYPLSGRVVAVDMQAKQAVVAHQEIPGFMDKMTMGFTLKDERDLARLAPGDRIEGTLHVGKESSFLEILTIQRGGADEEETATATPPGPQPGDEAPNVALLNHDGRRLRLADYRGRTLVLTFIFTRCPLPDYCPRMSMNLARIAESLEKQPGGRDRYQLLSVSFDPTYDTPQVMKDNRALFRAAESPAAVPWDFVTGTPDEVRHLAEFFGMHYEGQGLDIVHTLRTAVLDSQGKVVQVWTGNTWTPEEVLKVLAGK